MKKIINTPESLVLEMCHGITLAHPEIELITDYKILKKRALNPQKVTLISGGGSGHEPAHAGFIGQGLLDVAVCGDVFASPSQIQVYQAIKASASPAGTLLIIKNYSGDIMNFTNAMRMAQEEGLNVDFVKVDDDIAVNDSLYTVGRRGVAGTLFVHKLAGAAAQRGDSLAQVKAVAEKTIAGVKSLGFALNSCTVPAKGSPTFTLGANEMEYGVGIHGEPGIAREPMQNANALAGRMVAALVADLKLTAGAQVALLVNGFGATPLMELYLFNEAVTRELSSLNISCVRTLVGNYMTSIDMQGASLSLLKLDTELQELLDAPADSPALHISGQPSVARPYTALAKTKNSPAPFAGLQASSSLITNNTLSYANLQFMVHTMGQVIIANEVPFCELDAHAGDGDFGMSVAKGFKVVQAHFADLVAQPTPKEFLLACSLIIMEHCGGASGPIWGSAFRGAAMACGNLPSLTLPQVAAMMAGAVNGVQTTGERSFGRAAVPGDKTLIDALVPLVDDLQKQATANGALLDALHTSAAAAVQGAESTKNIVARMGRAGTVGERSLGHPDAGAYALGVIFTELAKAMKLS